MTIARQEGSDADRIDFSWQLWYVTRVLRIGRAEGQQVQLTISRTKPTDECAGRGPVSAPVASSFAGYYGYYYYPRLRRGARR
jgi:hypothetical protein